MFFCSAVLNRVGILDKIVIIKHDRISNDCLFFNHLQQSVSLSLLGQGGGGEEGKRGTWGASPLPLSQS